jgi:hypothetical protein
MRFVPIKYAEQQAVLALHRALRGFIVERTAQGNQLRGLLAEFGLSIPLGFKALTALMPQIWDRMRMSCPGSAATCSVDYLPIFSSLTDRSRSSTRNCKLGIERMQLLAGAAKDSWSWAAHGECAGRERKRREDLCAVMRSPPSIRPHRAVAADIRKIYSYWWIGGALNFCIDVSSVFS